MPTYEFDMPDGTKKRGSGETPEAAWQSLNTATPATPAGEGGANTEDKPRRIGDAMDALRGVAQGWLDPVEGIVQLAEKTTGWKVAPEGLRDWAREFRNRAQSTFAGQAGELAGNVINPVYAIPAAAVARGAALAGRAASGVLGAGRAARTLGSAMAPGGLAARALGGAAGAAMAPVSGGGDYWHTKGNQALLGGLVGGTLPALAEQAGGLGAQAVHAPWWMQQTLIPQTVSGATRGIASGVERVTPATMGGIVGEAVGQED
jgi:hypothetical protein